MTDTNMTLDQARMVVETAIRMNQAEIDKFKTRFDDNPKYALEWADAAYIAVANLDNLREIMGLVDYAGGADRTLETDAMMLRHLDQHFSVAVRMATVSSSTSTAKRTMALAMTEVSANWFDTSHFASGITRSFAVSVLEIPQS